MARLCGDCGRFHLTSVDGRDHDRARDHHAHQDVRSGDRRSAHARVRCTWKSRNPGVNVIDAAARGAGDGFQLALNIAAMLIAFLALIAMVNGGLGWVHARHRLGAGVLAANSGV